MPTDEIKLFKCALCGDYKLIEQLVEVPVRDFLFKKQICDICFEKIKLGKVILPDTDLLKTKEGGKI